MRVLSLLLLTVVVVSHALPQAPEGHAPAPQHGAPRQRPNMTSRLRSMITGAVGDMSGVYDRVRKGFTRTFNFQSRPNGFRNVNGEGPTFRNPIDPAVHTNEIAPARNSEGAPNAPVQQGFRRPGRRPNDFMLRVQQIVGNMRNMFQNFNRRMSGSTRRNTQFQGQANQGQQAHPAPAHHAAQPAPQNGEFRPLQ